MEINLGKLLQLAESATPGPWHWVNGETDKPRQLGEWRASLRTVDEYPTHSSYTLPKFIVEADEIRDENMDANADYIAAASPDVVAELVRRLKAAEDDADRYRWLTAEFGQTKLPAFLERNADICGYCPDGKQEIDTFIDGVRARAAQEADRG